MSSSKRPKTSAPSAAASYQQFTKQFIADLSKQDIHLLGQEQTDALLRQFWHFVQRRRTKQPSIRLFNVDQQRDGWTCKWTVLEIANDDMPFLVDSVTAVLNRHGLNVHLIMHPLVRVKRNHQGKLLAIQKPQSQLPGYEMESYIHVQFDTCDDPAKLKQLHQDVTTALRHVRVAVADWQKMRRKALAAAEDLGKTKRGLFAADDIAETQEFLRWVEDNKFTFLGYRELHFRGTTRKPRLSIVKNAGLGVLRDDQFMVFNAMLRDLQEQPEPVQRYVGNKRLIQITKTNVVSLVHRLAPMDAILVRHYDDQGRPKFDRLFIGLFTSACYMRTPRDIPLLRRKVERVQKLAKLDPVSHNGKSLTHILDTYPRDELFQISEKELFDHAMGILQLHERQHVALFVRRDPFMRFVTCLIFVPRDRYDSNLRQKFQKVLSDAFDGTAERFDVRIDDSPLARVFMIIQLRRDSQQRLPDRELEQQLQSISRAWADRLREVLLASYPPAQAIRLHQLYAKAFPPGYKAVTPLAIVLKDLEHLEVLQSSQDFSVDLSQDTEAPDKTVHLKLYNRQEPINLYDAMPIIENMGLQVTSEAGPFLVSPADSDRKIYVQDFVANVAISPQVFARSKQLFEDAFKKVWQREVDDDEFNRLVLLCGVPWRDVMVLRALARYLLQIRAPHSLSAIAATLGRQPVLTRLLVDLFQLRHNPALRAKAAKQLKQIQTKWADLLAKVSNLDDDRILRRLYNLVQASLRTNFFQTDRLGQPKRYLSIKFASQQVDGMPLPKPLYEIFVHAPEVEGIHLRGGKVARGGIRWSDREDFRTEILGLMKAQQVKNSVIVPVGAKGGFVVREALAGKGKGDGVACYQTFIRGLLDITDNQVDGKIVPPKNIVRNDGADPYLVVAADKGTAKFSDTANALSLEYGHWLGDAFASGGSVGYDHKEMGITARGTWEAVKRHFREIGKDIQREDFTVIGVGDMSGDVFGNGMLLSRHIKLIGAFDHRHIFCDPAPDAEKSFKERERLFHLPTSSWADYNPKLIAAGGGVFSRQEKAIKITPQMKTAYGIVQDVLSPNDLMQAMLRAEVELIYFGGIGTYVKAGSETHEQASDRANDSLRIDGKEIRAKVVGEGANMGMTQRGRIEYCLQGGRCNTDAIDNSAGVDTSDHEVNIKIALAPVVARGKLKAQKRVALLKAMTADVGQLVLRDNYLQTQALTIAHARGAETIEQHGRMMRMLEKAGLLNRRVEYLPDDDELLDRARKQQGLTRPELSVLLAYAKIWLYDQLLPSKVPDDPFLVEDLINYFPQQMRGPYRQAIMTHQLRREIIATAVTNNLINRTGSHALFKVMSRTGCTVADVTMVFLLTRESYELRSIWHQIEALDGKVPAAVQTAMMMHINKLMSRVLPTLLLRHQKGIALDKHIRFYRDGIRALRSWLSHTANETLTTEAKAAHAEWIAAGVPTDLAKTVAAMPMLASAPGIISLADSSRVSIEKAAEAFMQTGQRFGLAWLRARTMALTYTSQAQRDAALVLGEDIFNIQLRLAAVVLHKGKGKPFHAALTAWCDAHAGMVGSIEQLLGEWRVANDVDYAALVMMVRQLATLG